MKYNILRFGLFVFILSLFAISFPSYVLGQHYQKIWTNNPYQPMQIIVTSASINGINLDVDDEIGVFDIDGNTDDTVCVGSLVLTGGTGPFIVIASADDPFTPAVQDGFVDGHEIIFRLWDNSASLEAKEVYPAFSTPSGFVEVYLQRGTALVALEGLTPFTWRGTSDVNWENTNNWNGAMIPDERISVIIPTTPDGPFFPVVSSGTAKCKDLKIENGANITIDINGQLTIEGY